MGNRLRVNEIFGPTLQGEGFSVGKPVIFLRLSGCNLMCNFCDTPYTWNWKGSKFVHPEKFNPKLEMHFIETDQIYKQLSLLATYTRHKSLVISGGEPLLQQEALIPLLSKLNMYGWYVEIETNGTIIPSDSFLSLVDQINCSPKLSSSGPDNVLSRRIVPEALEALSKARHNRIFFKFVVSRKEDLPEILDLVDKYSMKNVYLMPEGKTREDQEKHQALVVEQCIKHGFNFSPRLHVTLWGTKRGV